MAEQKSGDQEAPAPKSKKMLIIIIVVVVLLAVAGGAAVMLLGGGKKHSKDDEVSAESKKVKTVVVPFEEKFTVNLRSDDGSNHYLQVPKIELEVYDAEVAKAIDEKKSKIRDRINSTLRSKSMSEMQQPGSDLKLKEELRSVINDALEIKSPSKGVKEVLLPDSFIVQ
ncbi:MAG: flagellar basal body-associated FliL family protein [Methylophilaceae bacterium]|nr:flagellar basal body-associated FliL family protein [Methylophilaceae bacterium]